MRVEVFVFIEAPYFILGNRGEPRQDVREHGKEGKQEGQAR